MNNQILASVQGKTITEADIDAMIVSLGQRGTAYNNPQGRQAILEQVINRKLLILDAEKKLYEFDPEFKAQLEQIKEELLANFVITKTVEGITVTDDEVKAEYENHKDHFNAGESVSASHILVDDEDKATSLMEKINNGEISFEDAARAHSSCPSKENGGSLGEFTRGQMVPEFDDACFNMNVGEIKGPVKTQFGYHIIKLNSKNEAKQMSFDEVKDGLRQKMIAERQQNAYESKINQLKIMYQVERY